LRKLDLPADMIATSDDWNAVKPDASFFRAVIDSAPCDAGGIVYVGDRLDNDLRPAKEAGMRAAFIRRGPWGLHLGASSGSACRGRLADDDTGRVAWHRGHS
jgi:FMN phosphatase YigB (HAD superfamily)